MDYHREVCWRDCYLTFPVINDQPLPEGKNSYIYADDRAIASQGKTPEKVQTCQSRTIAELDLY